MDFPRALIVLFLFFVFYLFIQFFLFSRIRDYLRRRIQDQRQQRLLSGLAASFFLLMLFPLAWRAITGLHLYGPDPWVVRGLFLISAIWVFGSTGLALMLLCRDFFRWAGLFFSPRPVAPPDFQRRDFLKKSVGVLAAAPFLISG